MTVKKNHRGVCPAVKYTRTHEGTKQGTLPQAVLGVGVSEKADFLWAPGSWSATWPGGPCEIVCFPVLNLNKVWGCVTENAKEAQDRFQPSRGLKPNWEKNFIL